MYGLPETHKKNVPLLPTLSVAGLAQHELAKFVSAALQQVLDLYSSNCTKDAFSFAQKVQQLEFNPDNSFFCPYDISVFSQMYHWMKLTKSVLTLSTMVNCRPLNFQKKFSLN